MAHFRPLLLLSATLALLCFVAPAQAGALVYPALGNLRLDEGCLEIWFTPMVKELYPPVAGEGYASVFSLFGITGSPEFNCGCSWYRHGSQIGLKVSLSDREQKNGIIAILTDTPRTWRPGEAHQVAFTWKGGEMAVYADGQLIGSRRQMGRFRGETGPLKLVIGSDRDATSRIIIHAVRVSSVARSPKELAQPPRADLATLLLDRMDAAPEKHETKAEVISGLSGERGGHIEGTARRVASPSNGMALYK